MVHDSGVGALQLRLQHPQQTVRVVNQKTLFPFSWAPDRLGDIKIYAMLDRIYDATMGTYAIALTHFLSELLIFRTANVQIPIAIPTVLACEFSLLLSASENLRLTLKRFRRG